MGEKSGEIKKKEFQTKEITLIMKGYKRKSRDYGTEVHDKRNRRKNLTLLTRELKNKEN